MSKPQQTILDPTEGTDYPGYNGTNLNLAAAGEGNIIFTTSTDTTAAAVQFPAPYLAPILLAAISHTGKTPTQLWEKAQEKGLIDTEKEQPLTRQQRRAQARRATKKDPHKPIPPTPGGDTFTDPDGDTLHIIGNAEGTRIKFTITPRTGNPVTAELPDTTLIVLFIYGGAETGMNANDLRAASDKLNLTAPVNARNRTMRRRAA